MKLKERLKKKEIRPTNNVNEKELYHDTVKKSDILCYNGGEARKKSDTLAIQKMEEDFEKKKLFSMKIPGGKRVSKFLRRLRHLLRV